MEGSEDSIISRLMQKYFSQWCKMHHISKWFIRFTLTSMQVTRLSIWSKFYVQHSLATELTLNTVQWFLKLLFNERVTFEIQPIQLKLLLPKLFVGDAATNECNSAVTARRLPKAIAVIAAIFNSAISRWRRQTVCMHCITILDFGLEQRTGVSGRTMIME